ncbi:beta-lactamase family protein [Leucobacter viscericola]|uniref:Beta-lactamase family protein n=1 Tax=Leucobacter viscericola TaxID=2714935 RepID=A0A6G7XK13_9MICO|nr:beta-lactamase family protein [Leucobacter viscericola]
MAPQLAESALLAAFEAHNLRSSPAALAAVFDESGVIAWKASGSPRNDGVPTSRDTVFRIASMSKSFLAAALLALRDEGALDLDRAVTDYVPGIRCVLNGNEESVSLRQLITNCSGLAEDNAWGDRMLGARREDIAALAAEGLLLTAEPGEKYQYSNLGMSFVARAIETVSGQTLEQFVESRFLEPLGLSNTRYDVEAYVDGTSVAAGFRNFDDGETYIEEPFVGSGALACIGGLFSTVDDVARWAAFVASAFTDRPQHTEVLSARSRREMQRIATVIPDGEDRPDRQLEAVGYGMGLVIEHDRRFGRIVQHSGGLPGFSSHMRWHLATGLGVVAFGNSDRFEAWGLATRALTETLTSADAPADTVQPWAATLEAAARIDRALQAGSSFSEVGEVFAENVMRDLPPEVRERQLSEALEQLGAVLPAQNELSARARSSAMPAELRWVIACERGNLECFIRLVGLSNPLVQTLTVAAQSQPLPKENATI